MKMVSATVCIYALCLILNYHTIMAKRRGKRTDIEFNSDTDVKSYLKDRNRDMVIFKCKKVVMIQWLHSVVPYVDLECEVLGTVTGVSWYINDTLIDTVSSGRFISLSQPHYYKRTYFNSWFDYKLRMLHVTEVDNGAYTIRISSPDGLVEHRDIMLSVSTDYREDKWVKWLDKDDPKKNDKRSRRRAERAHKRALMREIRKRASRRRDRNKGLIFD